jgi:predicted nucleotidyltransferase
MLETDAIKLKEIINKVLQKKNIHANKVVVFGSFVKGEFGKDSDIDVIIVSRDFRNKSIFERVKLATGIGRDLVKKVKKPFDLMYYSDEEWENKNYLIINEAKSHGE